MRVTVIGGVSLTLIWIAMSFTAAYAQDKRTQTFEQANAFYKENKFDQAISGYNKIVEQGLENGNIYYNLANSYFKKGELGKAILNYERSKILMPSDSDLKSNSEYALSLSGVDKTPKKAIERIFAGLNVDSLAMILFISQGAIFLILIFLTVLSFPRKRPAYRPSASPRGEQAGNPNNLSFPGLTGESRLRYFRFYKAAIACLAAAFLLAGWSFKRKIDWLNKGAVVIAQKSEARFEPLEGSTAHFVLRQGAKVEFLESTQSWVKIRRNDGKMGWVKKEAIELIKI